MTQPIPFYLILESSAVSLAAFLPFSPTAGTLGPRKVMRVQLMRQTTVDVRYGQVTSLISCVHIYTRNTTIAGVKTDIWRVDYIGEGTFTLVVSELQL